MDQHAFAVELDSAYRLARAGGRAVMRLYGSVRDDGSGDSPVTEADRASNRAIVDGLRAAFPDDAILSEESRDSRERLTAERVWIVDPLDGTKEFLAENGEFSVMIGFTVGGEPVAGVVYRPAHDVLYAAARGRSAWIERDGERRPLRRSPASQRAPRLVGSRSHADPLLERMRETLGITEVRPSGSVGVKCGLIAEGECDLYIHPVPYLKEWDTCAPEVILREAGGEVCDCLGDPLRYNKADPRQPNGILACAPGVRERVLEPVARLFGEAVAVGGRTPKR